MKTLGRKAPLSNKKHLFNDINNVKFEMLSSPAMELYNTAEVVLPGESVDGDRHGAVGRDRLQDLVLFANQTGDLQDIVPVNLPTGETTWNQ